MRIIKTKKGIALLAVLVVAAVAAIGGYAYFTSTGSGTGSAGVGSSGSIDLTSSPVSGVYPGGGAVQVAVTATNNNPGDEYVDTISGTVEDITTGPNAGCMGSWFTVTPAVVQQALTANGGHATVNAAVSMPSNLTTNQNACQGATLTIDWTSN